MVSAVARRGPSNKSFLVDTRDSYRGRSVVYSVSGGFSPSRDPSSLLLGADGPSARPEATGDLPVRRGKRKIVVRFGFSIKVQLQT